MLRLSIVVLGTATALIHLGIGLFGERFNPAFVLNGLGYLGLVTAVGISPGWMQGRRALLLGVFIAYAALTIVGWLAFGQRTVVDYLDKAIEILLVLALTWYWRVGDRPRSSAERARPGEAAEQSGP